MKREKVPAPAGGFQLAPHDTAAEAGPVDPMELLIVGGDAGPEFVAVYLEAIPLLPDLGVTEGDVLDRLERLRGVIDVLQPLLDDALEARAQMWRVGRGLSPKMTQRALAAASGCSDVAVAKKLGRGN